MNRVEKIFKESDTPAEFSLNYLKYLSEIFLKIDTTELQKLIEEILKARAEDRQIIFIGNGGSAATASHFANDIGIGTRPKGKPFRAISLTDNNAVMTAIANDFGYENLFVKQLETVLRKGDVVVAISASGNSPNILKAIEYSKYNGAITFGVTGFGGGKLREISQFALHVDTSNGEYGPVEDLHMIFDHIIGNYLMLHCKYNE